MAEVAVPSTTVLARRGKPTERETFADKAKLSDLPLSTYWHRVHGRPSRQDTAVKRQYLTSTEERALVNHVLRLAARGYPVPVKFLRYLAQWIVRQRSSTFQVPTADDKVLLPGKNWPQGFYKRHPELKPRTLRPLDWARHNIHEKVEQWFTVIGRELHDPAILAENVYNMDETRILLSVLTSRKFLISTDDMRRYRGAGMKRTLVTAMECISADGRCLDPLIIWPASTQRSAWTTHPTPGWHFTCSPSGYTNHDIVFDWYRCVFNPQTKSWANGRPRVLINDGFGPHESLEVMRFCHENNIIFCRLPSHTSHKLQPCDVGVFGPLKTAYRERVEDLYHGGANTVGKQHFTFLYSQARGATFTSRNVKSAWAKARLYPWNPNRVLRDIQKPPSQESPSKCIIVTVPDDKPLQTPVNAEGLTSLRRVIKQNMPALDDRSQQCLCKFANAAKRVMTARDLLFKENFDLFKQNNESHSRGSSNSNMVGKAKIMSYEDIQETQKKRYEKEAAGTGRRGRKRKNSAPELWPSKKSRKEEMEQANSEIQAWGMREFCSVF